ncbi:MAG TPA: transglutaminase-like domain-containing protein, partial [Acidimicrobiales bacterium]|nr:transglutaminase-like domain-containing protein [Acidimicrobiales bacterium]
MADVRGALRPSRADLVDVALGSLLAVLGVVGFRTTFAGGEELVVGVPAVLVGAAVGYALVKLRVPLLAGVAAATVVFFVLGGPLALRHRAVAGVLPSADAVSGLADGLINGWIRLLTTLPPAGEAGDLLAIPYLCGFAGGAVAVALALRFPARAWCVLPPTAVLVVSVLMGTKRPASLLLQGAAFAALTIAWVAARHHRGRMVTSTATSRSRLATAGGLLAVSAVGGFFVGPLLPGADTDDRYVLRQDVEPPFDPLTEPSPLASYRNYTDQDEREDPVLTVSGLPDGAHLRIAAMDSYSGTEWEATGDGSVLAGEYLRVGAEIPAEVDGPEREVTVEVHEPEGVWVPLAGDVTGLDFVGPRGGVLDDEVRVSIQTDTAAVPRELQAGDRYRFTARFVDLPAEDVLVETPLDSRFDRVEAVDLPTEFVSRASEWARNQPTPYAEMAAIAEGLRTEGAYTDGGEDANPVSPPGHSLRRLLDFISIEQPYGNGEQFAAAQGLLAQARGVPVRVAMGFVNERGEDEVTFRGEDIEAWIEVPVAGVGWVPVDGTPPEDQLPDPMKQPRSKTDNPEPQPPPPTTVPPPTSIPDELDPEEPEEEDEDDDGAGGIPGWVVAAGAVVGLPAVLVGGPALAIVGLKRRRRARRRTRGTPSQRVAG